MEKQTLFRGVGTKIIILDQVRKIKLKGWITEIEIEEMKRKHEERKSEVTDNRERHFCNVAQRSDRIDQAQIDTHEGPIDFISFSFLNIHTGYKFQ